MPTYLQGIPGAGDIEIPTVAESDTLSLGAVYYLSQEQASFFRRETGIDNDDDLRTHILDVQEKAYKVFPYPCIRAFTFLQPGISILPEYESIIKLGRERQNAVLLDVGCCFGVDARKAIADGFPLKGVVTADLKKELFDMGHALFKTTPETYPISFVAGDVFDPSMLQIVPPFDEPPSAEKPDLSTLMSLNPLAGRCTVIYAARLFHLFSEENQLRLAKALAGLLSAQPGAMICGEHTGNWTKGVAHPEVFGRRVDMFTHCPESWASLWDGVVFPKGSVRVNTTLEQIDKGWVTFHRLQWSVVKL